MLGIEEVLVAGAGSIGREVALQCAMFGYRVSVYDSSSAALQEARASNEITTHRLAGEYVSDSAEAIKRRLYYTLDLEEAAASADLVVESIPESVSAKSAFFTQVGPLVRPDAILTTNTSTFLPSQFAELSGRASRFLALHFHKTVWEANVVDVMPWAGTDPSVTAVVASFARSIGQVPIVLTGERQAFVFNSMLQAYMSVALVLWAQGVADHKDIDRAWMIAERAAHGPFGAMDHIGLDTVFDICTYWGERRADQDVLGAAVRLRTEFIEVGRLGVKSGTGFYSYPSPEFEDPTFTRPST